jgi:signal transduction histidine kinase
MAAVALSDSGHGMEPQVLRHVFEPFFTTKDAGTGTGLGLSVIQDLVRAIGGDIGVESAPGRGATFVLRLPLAAAAGVQAPALNT